MQLSMTRTGDKEESRSGRRHVGTSEQLVLVEEIEAVIPKMCPDYLKFEASIRHFVSRYLTDEQPNQSVIGVISPRGGDGNTTIALALAGTLADVYGSVVLLEMAAGSGVAEELQLPPGPGLRDFLSGDLEINEVLRRTSKSNLFLLSAGAVPERSLGLDRTAQTRALLKQLRSAFEVVVVDFPPLLTNEESPALLGQADSAVLVLEAGKTAMDDVARVTDLCGSVPLRGVFLNRFRDLPGWLVSLAGI